MSRTRLLAAGVGVVAAAGVGGTAYAASHDTSPVTLTATSTGSAAASPSPSAAHPRAHRALRHVRVVEVTAVSTGSITVRESNGRSRTLELSPRLRVVGPGGKTEAVTSIPAHEIVVIAVGRERGAALGQSTSAPIPATSPPAPGSASEPMVVLIRDTGFKAAS